jgi:hypothetical protein
VLEEAPSTTPAVPGTTPRYRRSPATLWRSYAGEVLLARREGDIRVLSATGADVWGLLGEPRSLAEVAEALADDYRAPAGAILEGVTSLVGELRDEGLVEEVSGA